MTGSARYGIFAASLALNAALAILIANAVVDRVPASPLAVDREVGSRALPSASAGAPGSQATADGAAKNTPAAGNAPVADAASAVQALPGEPSRLTTPAAIALKMMEQGFPEDFVILCFRGAVMRVAEREQMAALLSAGRRLSRWQPALTPDPATVAAQQEKQKSEFETGYREITRTMTPQARAAFDRSAFGQILLHPPFGPRPAP